MKPKLRWSAQCGVFPSATLFRDYHMYKHHGDTWLCATPPQSWKLSRPVASPVVRETPVGPRSEERRGQVFTSSCGSWLDELTCNLLFEGMLKHLQIFWLFGRATSAGPGRFQHFNYDLSIRNGIDVQACAVVMDPSRHLHGLFPNFMGIRERADTPAKASNTSLCCIWRQTRPYGLPDHFEHRARFIFRLRWRIWKQEERKMPGPKLSGRYLFPSALFPVCVFEQHGHKVDWRSSPLSAVTSELTWELSLSEQGKAAPLNCGKMQELDRARKSLTARPGLRRWNLLALSNKLSVIFRYNLKENLPDHHIRPWPQKKFSIGSFCGICLKKKNPHRAPSFARWQKPVRLPGRQIGKKKRVPIRGGLRLWNLAQQNKKINKVAPWGNFIS